MQIGVADEDIAAAEDRPLRLQQTRAIMNDPQCIQHVAVPHRMQVYQRVHQRVQRPRKGVPERGRTPERQNHVGARRDTPNREGLTPVFLMLPEPDPGGGIEQPPQPDGRIDDDTTEIAGARFHLALQQIVDRIAHIVEVAKYIADPAPQKPRRHGPVTLCHRLQNLAVGEIIEGLHLSIERFQGILAVLGQRRDAERQKQHNTH